MSLNDGNGSLDLLRLPNLQAIETYEEGEALIIKAKSRVASFQKCCLLAATVKMGTKTIRFRDHAIQGRPVQLEIRRQRVRCKQCGVVTYEKMPDLDTDHRMTKRFRLHLFQASIQHPFTIAAEINGVHETLVRRVFEQDSGAALKGYIPKMPRVLGMDEIYLHGTPRFVIGDVENRYMIDMQPSRRDIDLRDYLYLTINRDDVEVVCQDMWRGYRSATRLLFPNAVTVIDKYHVQRTANYGMEVVRRALYQGMSNAERVALKRRRAVFLARRDDAKDQSALDGLLAKYPALATAYDLKERFYDIYECETRAQAEAAMTAWVRTVPPGFERPFKTSLDAIKNWRPDILRYFEHRFTSAYIERLNGLIRKMNVAGAGYTFDVLRAKAILKHGKQTNMEFGGMIHIHKPESFIPMRYDVQLGLPISTFEADLDAGTFGP